MLETGSNFEQLSNITISQILIPSIIILFPSIILTHFNRIYSRRQEKTKYLNFIKNNSESVNSFISKISTYESYTSAKYFFLFEGILIGMLYSFKIISYIVSISDILVNSFLIKMFPYIILYILPTYNNTTDQNVNFLVFVSYFNNLNIAFLGVIFIWSLFLELKDYDFPKITENMSLTKWSMLVYYSYWFLMGILMGINIFILFFTIFAILNFAPEGQNFPISMTHFSSILTNLKIQMPTEKGSHIIRSYLFSFVVAFGAFCILYRCIIGFPIYFQKLIKDFYMPKFPRLLIKTESGDIFGQLCDFQNKSVLMLNENKVFKAVPWDQIRAIEMTNKEEQPTKYIKNEAIHPR